MSIRSRAFLLAWAALAGLFLGGPRAHAATIFVGDTGVSDCTFWCVDRVQQVYSASLFSGPTNISQVGFVASPFNGTAWTGASTWQMSLSTSVNPVGALSATFASNVGGDNAVFGTLTPAAGTPPANSLVAFNGSFIYDPGQGDLLVDIIRTAGPATGVGLDAGPNNVGLISRAYAFNSTVIADGVGPGNYALRTVFETSPVPEPATAGLLALGGIASLAALGHKRRRK